MVEKECFNVAHGQTEVCVQKICYICTSPSRPSCSRRHRTVNYQTGQKGGEYAQFTGLKKNAKVFGRNRNNVLTIWCQCKKYPSLILNKTLLLYILITWACYSTYIDQRKDTLTVELQEGSDFVQRRNVTGRTKCKWLFLIEGTVFRVSPSNTYEWRASVVSQEYHPWMKTLRSWELRKWLRTRKALNCSTNTSCKNQEMYEKRACCMYDLKINVQRRRVCETERVR